MLLAVLLVGGSSRAMLASAGSLVTPSNPVVVQPLIWFRTIMTFNMSQPSETKVVMTWVCLLQLDKDISAYTYEKTLAMEQRSKMLNLINKQRSGPASRQQQHRNIPVPLSAFVFQTSVLVVYCCLLYSVYFRMS